MLFISFRFKVAETSLCLCQQLKQRSNASCNSTKTLRLFTGLLRFLGSSRISFMLVACENLKNACRLTERFQAASFAAAAPVPPSGAVLKCNCSAPGCWPHGSISPTHYRYLARGTTVHRREELREQSTDRIAPRNMRKYTADIFFHSDAAAVNSCARPAHAPIDPMNHSASFDYRYRSCTDIRLFKRYVAMLTHGPHLALEYNEQFFFINDDKIFFHRQSSRSRFRLMTYLMKSGPDLVIESINPLPRSMLWQWWPMTMTITA